MKTNRRIGYETPEWFDQEAEKLLEQWKASDTELDIDEYMIENGSDALKKEFEKIKELFKDGDE